MGFFATSTDDPQYGRNMALFSGIANRDVPGALALFSNDQLKKKLIEAQLAESQAQTEERRGKMDLQRRSADRLAAMERALFGSVTPSAPGQLGSGSFGAVEPPAGQPSMPQPRSGGLGNATIEQIAAFRAAGGEDLLPAYKFAKEGVERKAGSFYEDLQGRRQYVPDPVKGIDYQGGRSSLIPGYADVQTQLTLANEAPKALLNAAGTQNLRDNADGTKSPVNALTENGTLQEVLQRVLGRPAMPQAAPRPAMPSAPIGAAPAVRPEPNLRGDFSGTPEQVAMQIAALPPQERANAQAAFEEQMKRTGGSLPRYGATTEQKAAAEAAAAGAKTKAEVDARAASERQTGVQKKNEAATDMVRNMQRAKNLLEMNPTASGIGAAADSAMGWVGASTRASQSASALESIAGWLTANVPRMEGPQSNFDVENYKIMAGRVGDRRLPVADRLAALGEVEAIQKRYATLNGGESASKPISFGDAAKEQRYQEWKRSQNK